MSPNHSKSIGKTVEVKASNRPIKIAYLVPTEESSINQMFLDAVFHESYSRWGGIYTLIIPSSSKGFLRAIYEPWLEFFDPDFVYTYVKLDSDLIKKIDRLCSPIAILKHEIKKSDFESSRWRDFIPYWHHYFEPISSITTIHSPHAHYKIFMEKDTEDEVTVITQFQEETNDRLLRDNFGTAFSQHNIANPIRGLLRTLCLVPTDLPSYIMAGSDRCTSFKEILSAISSRKALPVARFAMLHSEAIPKVNPNEWEHNFSIFIGNTQVDRIHFWNARHFIPSHSTTLGTLILDKGFFDDEDLVTLLGQYLNNNNFLGQERGSAKVAIRSYSHSKEELCLIRDKLGKHTYNYMSVPNNFNIPALPDTNDFKKSYFKTSVDTFNFKLSEDSNTLQAKEPSHFTFIPPRYKNMAWGQWIVELDIQRHNNLSKYSNVIDTWVLPRRRKIVQAFTKNLGKVTVDHRIAILPTTEKILIGGPSINIEYFYTLFLPKDEDFFLHLVLGFFKFPPDDLRESIPKNSYQDLSISDKGQNLRGVISMFDNLSTAYEILTNMYWRNVLRDGKEDSAKYLVFTKEQLEGFLPNDHVTKEKLKQKLNLNNIGKVSKFLRNSLSDTLEYLIRTKVFYCVHQWRCQYCGHTNSRSFDGMKIKNSCEICNTEYLAPIDLKWEYQINNFVYRSLVKQTGLTVLWALGYLQDLFSIRSFWYLPEVDLFEDDNDQEKKNEIDILCVIDGKFFAVEVKLSPQILIQKTDEVDKFVKKINLIQPDIAILSFERYSELENNIESTKTSLKKIHEDIRKRIDANIEVKILVAAEVPGFNDYPPELGWSGKRTWAMY